MQSELSKLHALESLCAEHQLEQSAKQRTDDWVQDLRDSYQVEKGMLLKDIDTLKKAFMDVSSYDDLVPVGSNSSTPYQIVLRIWTQRNVITSWRAALL